MLTILYFSLHHRLQCVRCCKLCDEYANKHSIVFNGSKSKCLISEPRKFSQLVRTLHRDMHQFVIGGKDIEFVDTFVHLGHVIRSDMDDNDDIENQRCKFIGQTISVLCYFGKLVSDVKYSLFESYCTLCPKNAHIIIF